MSNSDYFDAVVASRTKPTVLLTKVYSVRSGLPDVPIIIFEGKSDIAPYEVWFKRIIEKFTYKPLLAEGKKHALEFRRQVMESASKHLDSIYFVVDKDFDDLKGNEETENIFCTDKYSVENYLVSEDILKSVLIDEFECIGEDKVVDNIISDFGGQLFKFSEIMTDVNFRLYLSAKFSISKEKTGTKISPFVNFTLKNIGKVYSCEDLLMLIPLDREPTSEEIESGRLSFIEIEDCISSYRGKYLLTFFLGWLDLLGEARRSGNVYFSDPKKCNYNRSNLTLRSLASRSELPSKLPEFVAAISSNN